MSPLSQRRIPPVPPGFEKHFIEGGWRKVERMYGARTSLLLKWMEIVGRDELEAKRRDYLRGKK